VLNFIRIFILKFKGIKISYKSSLSNYTQINKSDDSRIYISTNVQIRKNVEIRVEKNSELFLDENVKLDNGVRIVVTNSSKVYIGLNTKIGYSSILNCGANLNIGKNCLISGFVYIQCSEHGFKKNINIIDQQHSHKEINISEDVWIGAHSTILMGVNLKKGTIIGANSLVNKDTEKNSINVGIPAKKIKER